MGELTDAELGDLIAATDPMTPAGMAARELATRRAASVARSAPVKRYIDLTGTVAEGMCGAVFQINGSERMCIRETPCPIQEHRRG